MCYFAFLSVFFSSSGWYIHIAVSCAEIKQERMMLMRISERDLERFQEMYEREKELHPDGNYSARVRLLDLGLRLIFLGVPVICILKVFPVFFGYEPADNSFTLLDWAIVAAVVGLAGLIPYFKRRKEARDASAGIETQETDTSRHSRNSSL